MTQPNEVETKILSVLRNLKAELDVDQVFGSDGRLGKFTIQKLLGVGGQAYVFRAIDEELNRPVVIKLYKRNLAPEYKKKVYEEGRALAKINSRHVAQCFGVEWNEGCPFLVLEWVDGVGLDELAKENRLSNEKIFGLMQQLVKGLRSVHAAGVLHLDVKPSNLIVSSDGGLKLIDFGLAVIRDGDGTGISSGTPAYVAPEIANCEFDSIGECTDMYGAGGVLHYLLTGRAPIEGASKSEVLANARQGNFCDAIGRSPDAPAKLSRLCQSLLQRNPADRCLGWEQLFEKLNGKSRRPGFLGLTFAAAAVLFVAMFVAHLNGWLASPLDSAINVTASSIPEEAIKGVLKNGVETTEMVERKNDFKVDFSFLTRDGNAWKKRQPTDGAFQLLAGEDVGFSMQADLDSYFAVYALEFSDDAKVAYRVFPDGGQAEPAKSKNEKLVHDCFEAEATLAGAKDFILVVAANREWYPKDKFVFSNPDSKQVFEQASDAIKGITSKDRHQLSVQIFPLHVEAEANDGMPVSHNTSFQHTGDDDQSLDELEKKSQAEINNLQFDDAAKTVAKLIKMATDEFGSDHPKTFEFELTAAKLLPAQRRFKEAQTSAEVLLKKAKRVFGENHVLTGKATLFQAQLSSQAGGFRKRVLLLNRANQIFDSGPAKISVANAAALNELANCRISLENWDDAVNCSTRAREVLDQLHKQGQLENYEFLNVQFEIYRTHSIMLRYERTLSGIRESLRYNQKAMEIAEKLGSVYKQSELLLVRAGVFKMARDYDKAIEAAEKALELVKQGKGDGHPNLLLILCHRRLAEVLSASFNPQEVTPKSQQALTRSYDEYQQAFSLAQKLDPQPFDVMANCLAQMGRAKRFEVNGGGQSREEARQLYLQALEYHIRQFEIARTGMDEPQLFDSANKIRVMVDLTFRTHRIDFRDNHPVRLTYANAIWDSKGLVNRTWRSQLDGIQSLEGFDAARTHLDQTSKQLGNQILSSALTKEPGVEKIKTLRKEKLNSLLELCNRVGDRTESVNLKFNELEKTLPTDVALVMFAQTIHRELGEEELKRQYQVLVLVREPNTNVINVGHVVIKDRKLVDEITKKWIDRLDVGAKKDVKGIKPKVKKPGDERELASQIRSLVWDQLKPALGGRKHLVVSSVGEISKLPWPAIPGENKKKYLAEDYSFSHLPDPQFIPRLVNASPVKSKGMLLVGDVDFGKPNPKTPIKWESLPQTRKELNQFQAIGKDTIPATVLTGEQANEQAVLKELGHHRYVLLSTHGFSFESEETEEDEEVNKGGRFGGRLGLGFLGPSPYALNGVVLSKANQVVHPIRDKDVFDQLLTGQEVMNLDLSETELVILSSCVSGSGQIRSLEGIFGIQSALQWAGVRSSLACQWSLLGEPATAITTSFLMHNLAGASKAESLQKAMLEMIEANQPPSLWAGWKLQGDWR